VPVPFYLVRHPDGDVLVDGGNPVAVARDARAHWGELADALEASMSEEDHCAPQLARLGVDSVPMIVQTHLHADHTGALGHFPDAEVIVHARELAAARAVDRPVGGGYVRADYDRPDIRWRTVEGDHDVFADGRVRLLETPGHAAGHLSLLITLDETGPVLLTADAADNHWQWEGRAEPRGWHSPEQARTSIDRLRGVAGDTGALLVFGHDPQNWAGLRRAPLRYA
jgi:glyoxylase-like metal-dependent hydrolase (beta-lactamase superfamily II)